RDARQKDAWARSIAGQRWDAGAGDDQIEAAANEIASNDPELCVDAEELETLLRQRLECDRGEIRKKGVGFDHELSRFRFDVVATRRAADLEPWRRLNETESDFPEHLTVWHMIRECLAADPDRAALVFEGRTLRAGELLRRVTTIANAMPHVSAGDRVAVF